MKDILLQLLIILSLPLFFLIMEIIRQLLLIPRNNKDNIKVINHIIDIKEEDKKFKIDNFNDKFVKPLKEQINNEKGE